MRSASPCRRRLAALLRHPAVAAVAALVWLLGVEIGPGMHIALHEGLEHHHHGPAELDACNDADEHHADAEHHDHHADAEHHEHHVDATHDDHHADAEHHDHHADAEHDDHHAAAAHEHHADTAHHEHHADTAHHERHAAAAHHEHHADAPHGDSHAVPHAHATGSVPHGVGSLAHRYLFSLTPPLALPPIASAPWRPFVPVVSPRVGPRRRAPETTRARGPPQGSPLLPSRLA